MEQKLNVSAADHGASSAQAHLMRGVEYKLGGNFDAAITELTRAIALDLKNEDAYAFRGDIYGHLGEWGKAIPDYTHAVALNQKDSYFVGRGIAYFMIENYNKSRSDLEAALRINPENDEAKMALEQLESIGH